MEDSLRKSLWVPQGFFLNPSSEKEVLLLKKFFFGLNVEQTAFLVGIASDIKEDTRNENVSFPKERKVFTLSREKRLSPKKDR
ncbi:MAG: hypothetical protein A2007_02810 [Verrucomicrobia bacterium GWC2_42_7]|nr:MAG: hypothetical protein A2007_02810 [Verrucomicrobia bacterium GWC2_42_7]